MASPDLQNTNFLPFKLEQKVSVFIRKWLHIHHTTSSLCFYSSVFPCPFRTLSSALKGSKISGNLLLRYLRDTLVSIRIPKLQTGTWRVEDAVLSWENNINSIRSVELCIIIDI